MKPIFLQQFSRVRGYLLLKVFTSLPFRSNSKTLYVGTRRYLMLHLNSFHCRQLSSGFIYSMFPPQIVGSTQIRFAVQSCTSTTHFHTGKKRDSQNVFVSTRADVPPLLVRRKKPMILTSYPAHLLWHALECPDFRCIDKNQFFGRIKSRFCSITHNISKNLLIVKTHYRFHKE